MPTPNTLRKVHAWASLRHQFTPRDAVGELALSYRTLCASVETIEDMGFAEETASGWRIIGDAIAFDAEIRKLEAKQAEDDSTQGLKPHERVRDVFQYAERCSAEG